MSDQLIRSTLLAISLLAGATHAQGTGFRFDGDSNSDFLGYCVDGAGDVNGDGYDDLIVGAYGEDRTGTNTGTAWVFSGRDGVQLRVLDGTNAGDNFGYSVAGAGDVDDDGYADVIVGAPQQPLIPGSGNGEARVVSGFDGATLYTLNGDGPNDSFGFCVDGAGDVNGDGHEDVIIGAIEDDDQGLSCGSARVVSGADGSVLYTFYGDSAGDLLGWSVSKAGDVNGDGFDDVIAGMPGHGDSVGMARVYSGVDGTVLHTFTGGGAGDQFGISVSGAGDTNLDGFDDLIVGAVGDDGNGANAGSAKVFSGLDGAPLFTVYGDSPEDGAGLSVSSAGDVNGDWFADVIVGTPGATHNGPGSGAARIHSGLDGSLLRVLHGDAVGDTFGACVSNAGDIDADGVYDVIVGAPGVDRADIDSGSAYVFDRLPHVPAVENIHGTACVGADGRLPRIGYIGHAQIGTVIQITLRGAAISTPVAGLAVGHATELPLDFLGLTGCTVYTEPFTTVIVPTDSFGMASISVLIANDPGLFGVAVEFQWMIVDHGAPYSLPLSFSDAMTLIYGN